MHVAPQMQCDCQRKCGAVYGWPWYVRSLLPKLAGSRRWANGISRTASTSAAFGATRAARRPLPPTAPRENCSRHIDRRKPPQEFDREPRSPQFVKLPHGGHRSPVSPIDPPAGQTNLPGMRGQSRVPNRQRQMPAVVVRIEQHEHRRLPCFGQPGHTVAPTSAAAQTATQPSDPARDRQGRRQVAGEDGGSWKGMGKMKDKEKRLEIGIKLHETRCSTHQRQGLHPSFILHPSSFILHPFFLSR